MAICGPLDVANSSVDEVVVGISLAGHQRDLDHVVGGTRHTSIDGGIHPAQYGYMQQEFDVTAASSTAIFLQSWYCFVFVVVVSPDYSFGIASVLLLIPYLYMRMSSRGPATFDLNPVRHFCMKIDFPSHTPRRLNLVANY